MFTARDTIRPIVSSETTDCTPMMHFAIGVSGIVSVGENAVLFVSETLREQEVRLSVVARRASAGAAAVHLPVPQREDQQVRQPDQHAGDDQAATVGDVMVQQVVRQRAEREDVRGADERRQRERDAPPPRMLVLDHVWRDDDQAEEQHALERGHEP